jgi:hypothetical protein
MDQQKDLQTGYQKEPRTSTAEPKRRWTGLWKESKTDPCSEKRLEYYWG